jgi:DNA-binding PadR family transcriptional regulator
MGLGKAEGAILKFLDDGRARYGKEIKEALKEAGFQFAALTVYVYLTNLEEKGFVVSRGMTDGRRIYRLNRR